MGKPTPDIKLISSTGDVRADVLLASMVSALEQSFEGRIRSYFLTGSYHEGTAIPGSDLDGVAVFEGAIRDEERSKAQEVIDSFDDSEIRLDFKPISKKQLSSGARLALPGASTLIFGEDIRGQLPPPSMNSFRKQTVAVCLGYLAMLREVDGVTPTIEYPLNYPDVNGEFFGYDLADKRLGDAGTRNLVATVTVLATAQVVMNAEQIVLSKREAVQAYKELDTGEWPLHVEEIFTTCREGWHYRISDESEDRAWLREVCRKNLDYENYCLPQLMTIGALRR